MPLFPAIAILVAGAVESKVLSPWRWLVRGTMFWFLVPVIVSIIAIVAAIIISRDLVLVAWPFLAGAIVCGLFAWQLFDDDGAEHAFVRATAASVMMAIGIYAVVVPALTPAFPSVALAEVLHDASCPHPVAASVGYEEPSLVFLTGTTTHFTDAAGAADFLRQGGCRFAFIESPKERAFALRAEAIGLRYNAGPSVEAFNISIGHPITIAVFQSAESP